MKPVTPLMTKSDLQHTVFVRYKDHLENVARLERETAVEIAQASAIAATIARNDWMEDFKAWMTAPCN